MRDNALGPQPHGELDAVAHHVDHAGDYAILPVRIRIEWNGRAGDRAYEAYTTFTDQ